LTLGDPYEILGIEPEADAGEIRRRFRELSLRYHPDKVDRDQSMSDERKLLLHDRYLAMVTAYEVLSSNLPLGVGDSVGEPLAFHTNHQVLASKWMVIVYLCVLILCSILFCYTVNTVGSDQGAASGLDPEDDVFFDCERNN
jgi:curved DNA-binding protein CbpA